MRIPLGHADWVWAGGLACSPSAVALDGGDRCHLVAHVLAGGGVANLLWDKDGCHDVSPSGDEREEGQATYVGALASTSDILPLPPIPSHRATYFIVLSPSRAATTTTTTTTDDDDDDDERRRRRRQPSENQVPGNPV